ncbi:MAG: hypothetical protein Q8904_08275 [Bacteroidota bacterium]|nr:hypothetical protein [Bacteroidota bacterium]
MSFFEPELFDASYFCSLWNVENEDTLNQVFVDPDFRIGMDKKEK